MKRAEPAPIPEHRPQAPSQPEQDAQRKRLMDAWRTPKGWRYWSAVNNAEVGLWYTTAALFFFLFAGVLALVMRTQLAVPDNALISADLYDELFTMHGSVMMFLFAIPIFEAFSIMVLPEMLGCRDLPFPRLSAYGFWCFIIGGVFVAGSLFLGLAPRGGWFMYPPLTSQFVEGYGPDIWLLGLSFIEVASIAAAVELIVGVLKCRPPGMNINLMPLYAWYILVVAIMILFAFPPLIAGDLMLELERSMDWPFFDAARGGDPLLWQHLFWIFGHPEVYIIFLPSVALVAQMIPAFARKPMVGYAWIVLAAVGTGFLSFGLWVHHMFATGMPGISLGIFSAASEAVAIPTGVQLFCFIGTLLAGKAKYRLPMLFILGGFSTFIIGGLTGVMVAIAPFDLQAHDSYFIVGHLHSVLIGGTLFPIFGAIYFFFPLVKGKQLSERVGRWAFWLMFVGYNVCFLPMHFTGLLGMPRRIYTYPSQWGIDGLNLVSTIGAFVLALGVLIFVVEVLRPRGKQPYAERNPWEAGTLEWLAEMPDQPWGSRSIPIIESRYPLWDQEDVMKHVDEGRFFLPDAKEGKRETLVTTVVDALPLQVLRVGGPTFKTHLAALFTGGVFILGTFHLYVAAAISGVLAMGVICWWLWTGTAEIPEAPTKDAGMGVELPIYLSGPQAVGWWAMLITMLADFTAFVALGFGYLFYWTVNPTWPPEGAPRIGLTWASMAAVATLVAWGGTVAARQLNARPSPRAFYAAATVAITATAASCFAMIRIPLSAGLEPTSHVYPAMVCALVIWAVMHLSLGGVMQAYAVARRLAGRMDAEHDADIVNVTLYWHFAGLTGLLTVLLIAGFPRVL